MASPLSRACTLAPLLGLFLVPLAGPKAAKTPAPALESDAEPRPVPALGIDLSTLTVSGLSSGGYMAVQMQTAFSQSVKGAAVFAGGPYGCARGNGSIATLTEALMHCVNIEGALWNPRKSYLGPPPVPPRVRDAIALAEKGEIDPVAALADDRVYLFSGLNDQTVPQDVMLALRDWYQAFMPPEQVVVNFQSSAGHAMVTEDQGGDCAVSESPFINDCDIDGAGQALDALYGPLTANDGSQGGSLYAINQQDHIPAGRASGSSIHAQAHLFVPDRCQGDAAQDCRLHVAFHGCRQTQEAIGDQFYTLSGYNRWAAANRIIVLYPQAQSSAANPRGCWDWWGYSGQDYLTKQGVQMQTVWSMIERLSQKP